MGFDSRAFESEQRLVLLDQALVSDQALSSAYHEIDTTFAQLNEIELHEGWPRLLSEKTGGRGAADEIESGCEKEAFLHSKP